MSDVTKFAAIFTFSTQVGDCQWRVVRSVKECAPETTLADIAAWQKSKSVMSPISLTIEVME